MITYLVIFHVAPLELREDRMLCDNRKEGWVLCDAGKQAQNK